MRSSTHLPDCMYLPSTLHSHQPAASCSPPPLQFTHLPGEVHVSAYTTPKYVVVDMSLLLES